jgi:CDGSH-type Zn-finger protein
MTDAVPNIAQRGPFAVEVEAGKTYFWCACGNSRKQPFCDGSHKGGPFNPVRFTALESATVYLCGCKHTGNKPYCDGTHARV